jgi:adenylate cyclase class 2
MDEVEIKFRVNDSAALLERARRAGFAEVTSPTHEFNTLYDTPDRKLRQRGQLLRLRQYGGHSILTQKSRPPDENALTDRYKRRIELETEVSDGDIMAQVLTTLGYGPVFRYEKYRAEWADGEGHLVLDETPLGTLAELEGEPAWIDRVAEQLSIHPAEYMTASYGTLFLEWKAATGHPAQNMTFAEMAVPVPASFVNSAN